MGTQVPQPMAATIALASSASHDGRIRFARVKSRCRGSSFVWLEEFMLGLSAHLGYIR
jgi:hypothetical protein